MSDSSIESGWMSEKDYEKKVFGPLLKDLRRGAYGESWSSNTSDSGSNSEADRAAALGRVGEFLGSRSNVADWLVPALAAKADEMGGIHTFHDYSGRADSYYGDADLLMGLRGLTSMFAGKAAAGAAKTPLVVNEATIAKALDGSTMQTLQGRVSQPMVERYVRMLEAGKMPPPIQVADGVIVNGNHRYVAGRLFGIEPPTVPYVRPSTSVPKPIQQTTVDPLDWGGY